MESAARTICIGRVLAFVASFAESYMWRECPVVMELIWLRHAHVCVACLIHDLYDFLLLPLFLFCVFFTNMAWSFKTPIICFAVSKLLFANSTKCIHYCLLLCNYIIWRHTNAIVCDVTQWFLGVVLLLLRHCRKGILVVFMAFALYVMKK